METTLRQTCQELTMTLERHWWNQWFPSVGVFIVDFEQVIRKSGGEIRENMSLFAWNFKYLLIKIYTLIGSYRQ